MPIKVSTTDKILAGHCMQIVAFADLRAHSNATLKCLPKQYKITRK